MIPHSPEQLKRPIPSTGELIPALGLGTYHLGENMQAGLGPMPDGNAREKMARFVEGL